MKDTDIPDGCARLNVLGPWSSLWDPLLQGRMNVIENLKSILGTNQVPESETK